MKMRYCFVTILLFNFSMVGFGQSSTIVIANTESKAPVPLATVLSDSSGFYANLEGRFERNLLKDSKYTVSCVGFESIEFSSKTARDTIFLKPREENIGEAVVYGDFESFETGIHKPKGGVSSSKGANNYKVATRIKSQEQRDLLIEEIIIPFKKIKKGSEFKVFLLEVKADDTPGDLLFMRTIVHDNWRNTSRIDVKNENLQMPQNGVYVGFGWVLKPNGTDADNPPRISFTPECRDCTTYDLVFNTWQKHFFIEDDEYCFQIGLKLKPY